MEAHGRRDPLAKALQVLEFLADRLPSDGGVREIANGLGLPPATVHRILRLLETEGAVTSTGDNGRYHVDFRFLRLAWTTSARYPITGVALPIMRDLVDEIDETAFLGLYDPSRMEMIVAERVESSHPLQYVVELNQWLPVYAGAGGLGIMSFLPKNERDAIVRRTELEPLTDRTISDPDKLETAMAEFRRHGYVMTAGQRVKGAVGWAAPIWGPAERVIGDLVVTIPEHRQDSSDETRIAKCLISHADRITGAINGRVGSPADDVAVQLQVGAK